MKRVGRGVWNKEHEIKGPEGSQDVIRVELQNLKIKFELCWLGRATVRSPCEFSYSLLPVNSWITARKSVACARHAPCAIYHGRTDDRVLRSRRFLATMHIAYQRVLFMCTHGRHRCLPNIDLYSAYCSGLRVLHRGRI